MYWGYVARFWQWGGLGGGLCKKTSGQPPCQPEPIAVGSKTDPLLAKAEPVSNGGGTSGKARMRTDKKRCIAAVREE